jgi:hypothetical protein
MGTFSPNKKFVGFLENIGGC